MNTKELDKEDLELLSSKGWTIAGNLLKMEHEDGSVITGEAVKTMISYILEEELHVQTQMDNVRELDDNEEKLSQCKDIAEEIANQFTYEMSLLEDLIQDVINESSREELDNMGYYNVADVTCDINVKPSYKW